MKTINIDSQILNSIQLCARKTKYQFIDNIAFPEKSEPMERGDLLHKMFEVYYGLRGDCLNPEGEAIKTIHELNIMVDKNFNAAREAVPLALTLGQYYATKMALPEEEVASVFYQFKEYDKYYHDDGWHPLEVESVSSKELYVDEEVRFVYNGKIDLFAEHGNLKLPWDHKHSQRRQTPSSLSNQFTGYAWLMESDHVLVNKVGFQKTLAPSERFQREILTYSKAQIEEWKDNTIWWCHMLYGHILADDWPMNLTSCDKYGGCIFSRICERDPSTREMVIDRDYKIQGQWDVAHILEAK